MIDATEGERESFSAIGEKPKAAFEAAAEMINASANAVTALLRSSPKTSSNFLKTVLLGIAFDCARKFRAIYGLCQIGHDENAEILTRSLFETVLAERFILRNRSARAKLPKQPRSHAPRDFRAMLYVAGAAITVDELVNRAVSTKRMKRTVTAASRRSIRTSAVDSETKVGAAWASWIRKHRSWSGLNVREMSVRGGLLREYLTLYGLQSGAVHGTDCTRHIIIAGSKVSLRTEPNFVEAAQKLGVAASYLGLALDDIGKALNSDTERITRPAYEALKDAIQKCR